MGSSEYEEDMEYIKAVQVVDSFGVHGVLRALFELNVFEIFMAKAGPHGYLSPSEIAANLPTQNPEAPAMLDRMLRLLASHSILNCTLKKTTNSNDGHTTRLYGLTPMSKYFSRNQQPGRPSAAFPFLFCHHKAIQHSWYSLKDAILEGGIPFNKAHGIHIFDYLQKDTTLNEIFSQGMENSSSNAMIKILEMYKGFEGIKQLVDVGGGLGTTLCSIVSKYPNIKGINFDLPHVIRNAPQISGVDHVGGDMFEDVPKGEVILLKRILHDWKDEECTRVLRNCYEALPKSGKVVVIEMVLTELPETDLISKTVAQLHMDMLMATNGGRERTEKEFDALARAAGFAASKFVCLADLYGIIELYKINM